MTGKKSPLTLKRHIRGRGYVDSVIPWEVTPCYIRPEIAGKNIVFPYDQHAEHWVIGFVYKRVEGKQDATGRIDSFDTLHEIPIPFDDVEVFMQEKWRIAGDRAGSGNTANMGSITGTMDDFRSGNGVFQTEQEFLEYWRVMSAPHQSANYRTPASVNFTKETDANGETIQCQGSRAREPRTSSPSKTAPWSRSRTRTTSRADTSYAPICGWMRHSTRP